MSQFIPNSNISLFAEICAITGTLDVEIREKLWKCLNKYKVQEKATYKNFNSCIEHFLNAKISENLSSETVRNYKDRLRLTSAYFNNQAPATLTTDDIRGLIKHWSEERGMKKSSVQTCINYTRNFFNWMYNEEMIPSNPFVKIKSFHIDKTVARKPLKQYDLERFRAACKTPRERALVEFFVSTGCRVGELINIKTEDINWVDRTVDVIGKGNKKRTIIFSVRAKVFLEDYLKISKNTKYLFSSKKAPYDKLSKEAVEKIIRTIGKNAGITEHVYPHKLRHTFATNALNAGMQITTIQTLLGHADLATTQIYAKIRKETIINDYNRVLN